PAFGLVARAIPVERLLPSPRLAAIGEEDETRRFPVARHEAIEIAPVPGICLGRPDGSDFRYGIGTARLRWRACGADEQQQRCRPESHSIAHDDVTGRCRSCTETARRA